MRHFTLILTTAAVAALMAAGCHEKPEGGDGSVSLYSEAEMTLPAAETDTVISFTATADWTAAVEDGEWLSVSPASGEAGEISATLSATANSEADARTATVRISCGTDEATVTITQEGAAEDEPEEPENPDTPPTGLIKDITVTDISSDDTYRITFDYDSEARLTTMDVSNTFYEDSEEITTSVRYEMEYSEKSIVLSAKALEGYIAGTYSERQEAVLDENGRAVSTKFISTSKDGDDSIDETEVNLSFSYNSSGQLVKANGTENGDFDFHFDFTWADGDMTDLSSTYGSDYNAGYRYSEYENTGNIDLNYILVDGYPTWIYPLGIIGALGERSEHYVWPDFGDYSYPDSNIGVDYPIHKDLIGTTFEHIYTSHASGEPEVTYSFIPAEGSEDGLLSAIVKSIPQYEITYTRTYRYILEDPSIQSDEEGYYHYGVGLEAVGDRVETGRETLKPEVTEVTIGY